MKKISIILLCIVTIVTGLNAQSTRSASNQRICDFGITFEISSVPGWGYGEPVILTVQPFSPADKAGLKPGDIIMEVNSTATYLRNNQTINNWLTDTTTPDIRLTIRNTNTYFKEYTITRQCKNLNSISEFKLASAYSFYSIEDTQQRAFSLPMRVDPNLDIDFSDYHTFDIIRESGASEIDNYVNSVFEKVLIDKGLTRSTTEPDILVQTYYTFQPNVKYNASRNNSNQKTWRYDTEKQQMVQVPILSAEDPNAETKGQYILELGIRFFDKKYIDKQRMTQIWDCKTRELLTSQYDLQEYARMHAPLMMMQYPYSAPKTIAKYQVNFKAFNYTGMNFDVRDMKTLSDIDANSPASLAGLKSGDEVVRINNNKFSYEIPEIESGYRRFIVETMPLRDKRTRFIDANGFPDCMYWDKSKYNEVAETFTKESIYTPCFSYLYSFQRYVSGASANAPIEVEIRTKGGATKTVKITPQLQRSLTVRAL
ncbi:MAG: PDZ domain-containing protein [Dysgonomonas sp.]|nr:PDZ domain-containing protein [Dysgonomonas sp.]